jgi:hypothetical protein
MLEKLAQEIVENCQPFLQQIDFNVSVNQLLRGMKPATGKYRHVTHANRIPRSTPLYIHQLNDDWFLQNHGHKFRSHHSLFCTGKLDMAGEFGQQHLIFPVGEISYAWSAEVDDLFKLYKDKLQDDPTQVPAETGVRVMGEILSGLLKKKAYQTDGLVDAIQSGNEIMIFCKEYYAIPQAEIPALLNHIVM